jgi:nicotinamidase-related amidase
VDRRASDGTVVHERRLGVPATASPWLVVDVQRGFDDPVWSRHADPACERDVGVDRARARGRPIVVVRHDSDEPGSSLASGSTGNA